MEPIRARYAGTCARTGQSYPAGALIVKLGSGKWALAQTRAGAIKQAPPEPDFRVVRLPNGKIEENLNVNAPCICSECLKADGKYEDAKAGKIDTVPYRMARTGDGFRCERCGRSITILTEDEVWSEVTLPRLHFTDDNTLSHKVGPGRWESIKAYFEYVRYADLADMYDQCDDFDLAREYEGRRGGEWRLHRGQDVVRVEEILGILPENRLSALRAKWAQEEAESKAAAAADAAVRAEIEALRQRAFPRDGTDGKQIWGEDLGETEGVSLNSGRIPIRLLGRTVNIGAGQNVYGGGEWYVLDADGAHVWHVRNNGMDGDCWAWNNIVTGGAGAIGTRFPLTPERSDYLARLEAYQASKGDGSATD